MTDHRESVLGPTWALFDEAREQRRSALEMVRALLLVVLHYGDHKYINERTRVLRCANAALSIRPLEASR